MSKPDMFLYGRTVKNGSVNESDEDNVTARRQTLLQEPQGVHGVVVKYFWWRHVRNGVGKFVADVVSDKGVKMYELIWVWACYRYKLP